MIFPIVDKQRPAIHSADQLADLVRDQQGLGLNLYGIIMLQGFLYF